MMLKEPMEISSLYVIKSEFNDKNIVSLEEVEKYIEAFDLETKSPEFREKVKIDQNKREQVKIKQYLKRR